MTTTRRFVTFALALFGGQVHAVGDIDRHHSPEFGNDVAFLSGEQRHEDGLILGKDVHHLPTHYCRLNEQGIFGNPSGEPTELEYAFGIETPPGPDFDSIFEAVGYSVEDVLLAAAFPQRCSYRLDKSRRLNRIYPVHALKFDHAMEPMSTKCEPLTHVDAKCNIFKGTVLVYGDTAFLREIIDYHLSDEETADIHDDVLRIFAVGEDGVIYGESSRSGDGGLKAGAIVGIVISILALLVGVAGFMWFERKRRQEKSKSFDDGFMNAEVNIAVGESYSHSGSTHQAEFTTIDLTENESLMIEDGRPTAVITNDILQQDEKFLNEDVKLL